jgi:methanogenic corrinoid protein MtbC1
MLIHHLGHRDPSTPYAFSQDDIAEFGALAMSANGAESADFFKSMLAKGHRLDTLFVHLLAPTARYLGELWDQDRCDFVDVTIGVARLQEILAFFESARQTPIVDDHHRALLITRPEEKHFFGLDMVAKLMRAAGWDVVVGKGLSAADNILTAKKNWFGVIGITLSGDAGIKDVGRTIETIRRTSRNRKIGVMVGGPAFTGNPDLAVRVGADAVADDGPAAVILAKKLLLEQFLKKK